MSTNIIQQVYPINKEMRNKLNKHNSFVLWFTGLSGSGKSTIAASVEQELYKKGIKTYTLDGDNLRGGINADLGFTEFDRNENLRRTAQICKLFIDAGVVTIAAFVSPLIKDREMIREIVGKQDYIEVFVNTSLEECEKRDVKGLYKKARKGLISNFTGINAPYENPINPDITINTETESLSEAVNKIVKHILNKIES